MGRWDTERGGGTRISIVNVNRTMEEVQRMSEIFFISTMMCGATCAKPHGKPTFTTVETNFDKAKTRLPTKCYKYCSYLREPTLECTEVL